MPSERSRFLTIKLPEFDGFVITSGGENFAIGAETDAIDRVAMSFECSEYLSFTAP